MWLTENDFKMVIGEKALETITQISEEIRSMAETEALEEMSAYLRARFDVEKIFSTVGAERNPQLVMYGCDIALYHMSASLPQRQGTEVREERYNKAIAWLNAVADGKITPLLPTETANEQVSSIIIGGEPKLNNAW